MKKIFALATFFVVLIYTQTFGQLGFGEPKDSTGFETKINPDFFLLGTFSDYMGRFQYVDRETQIDRYYPYEETLAKYISDFIFKNYNLKTDFKFSKTRHSEIFSPTLAKQLHDKYFDKNGNFFDELLDTEEKKYSFLLGTYYRYGEQLEGDIYKIQVVNSPKDKQLYTILKELDCDKIVYKFLRGYIPTSNIFYFVATPRMIKYFKTIEKEKEVLRKSFLKTMFHEKFEEEKLEDLNEKIGEHQRELIKGLKLIFRYPLN